MTATELNPQQLLPGEAPVRLVDESGTPVQAEGFELPASGVLRELHRSMVLGRRFDRQATALTKQGRLAVYPSSAGQEACQVGAVQALGAGDWLFPTYRDSVALVTHGVPPVEVLELLRGGWHCGYDPYRYRAGPQCTPLATNALHAVGLAHAARLRGEDAAALVFVGDGATSEGDAHEAFNFAAVWGAPVVFFVQNNQWAISVPLDKQSKAPTLAHKAIGYGMPGHHVDGNDAAAVYAVTARALSEARAGNGPSLVEGLTYRMDAHTNADDATRYRLGDEVDLWRERDPLDRLAALLRESGLLDDASAHAVDEEAEGLAADVRAQLGTDVHLNPDELFAHVHAEPTRLREQADLLAEELPAEQEEI
ncbi:pyruvate dehydrogenase E1 component alpha subunit [Halopolyspora algeriensis]|uniref:2-oxoisovalerate dehydrogenase subunit alpha n=1 Tax=Halopolyspora algeriensis TaxID=1500506 RepID=A0A368VHN8_9ACTN|nr:thiamine pyrophosphate-dependent dehydrogenase E1 component subunit alpha [Halopolyspora algeriensis]RCW39715.1 pyruvate dehydrogenase E1 component alpha subunit [Halopolyspora algeriensis]TQM53993.1 pyruvate dehydrogenase E1 component alpha subunit [Halopolyspora algeriensis]